jgi:hypothetical protein
MDRTQNVSNGEKSNGLQPLHQLLTKRAEAPDSSHGRVSKLLPIKAPVRHPASYTILLEHSASLSDRISSSMPREIAISAKERAMYDRSGIMDPGEMALKNATGKWLFREMLKILIKQHDGFVIFVDVTGSTVIGSNESNDSCWSLFQRNGVIIDLVSDPFGWGIGNEGKVSNSSCDKFNVKRIVCAANFTELLSAIRTETARLAETKAEKSQDKLSCQSIPVIIDSMAPFLAFQGEGPTLSFIKCLQHQRQSVEGSFVINSPIMISSMQGAASNNNHRSLEDKLSDAVVTLLHGDISILRKSKMTGKVTVEKQPFSIADSPGLLSRQPILHSPSDVAHIAGESPEDEATGITEQSLPVPVLRPLMETNSTRQRMGKVTLSLDENVRKGVSNAETGEQKTPKIFMQNDDPEFDDLDEEDPDDDLDF